MTQMAPSKGPAPGEVVALGKCPVFLLSTTGRWLTLLAFLCHFRIFSVFLMTWQV